jgi:hypothetical protein
MKVKTNVKAGGELIGHGVRVNRCETQVRKGSTK